MAVIGRLNPILRGGPGTTERSCPRKVFGDIDDTLWWTLFKWGRRQHNTKTGQWVVDRYFGRFHPSRQDRWIFGDRATGAYLRKLSLDADPSSPDGQGRRVPRRPDSDLLLATATTATSAFQTRLHHRPVTIDARKGLA